MNKYFQYPLSIWSNFPSSNLSKQLSIVCKISVTRRVVTTVKQQLEVPKIKVEDLHHSISIKEEIRILESRVGVKWETYL